MKSLMTLAAGCLAVVALQGIPLQAASDVQGVPGGEAPQIVTLWTNPICWLYPNLSICK